MINELNIKEKTERLILEKLENDLKNCFAFSFSSGKLRTKELNKLRKEIRTQKRIYFSALFDLEEYKKMVV